MNKKLFQPAENITTLQLEKDLRTQVETLKKMKHDRLKQLKRLTTVEQQLCDSLCMTPYYIPSNTVPSDEQLRELSQHIATLTEEQVGAHSIWKNPFVQSRHAISGI